MKKVAVILADGFEEIEALTSVDVLRRAGALASIASLKDAQIRGAHNINVKADVTLREVEELGYDAIVLPGGLPGAENLANDAKLREILQEFDKEGKLICAICAAPMLLGKLGLLKGRKATCYPGFEQYLEGAECTGAPVERDGNIITGKGPGAAMEFALTVVDMMLGKEKVQELKEAMCVI